MTPVPRDYQGIDTLEQIEQIRWLAGTRTLTQRQIAKRFSISQGHVSDIHNGHRWGAD